MPDAPILKYPNHLTPNSASSLPLSALLLFLIVGQAFPTEFRTDVQSSGNKLAAGHIDLRNVNPLKIDLPHRPQWIVGSPWKNGLLWSIQFTDLTTSHFFVLGRQVEELDLSNEMPGQTILARLSAPPGSGSFTIPSNQSPSADSHPVRISPSSGSVWLDKSGNLVQQFGNTTRTLPLNALPDARLAHNSRDTIAVLSDPTTSYIHNVLGDIYEAASISLVRIHPNAVNQPQLIRKITMQNNWVIEGISPIFADWDGDGSLEVLVTRSRSGDGGQLALFSMNGDLLATSASIGRSFRWRHQIAIAPFSPEPDSPPLLAAVLTPHIGGVIEYFQWDGPQSNSIKPVHRLAGFTSHIIATRNLDMAVAGDFLNDGRPSLLIPSQSRSSLGIIRLDTNGPQVIHSIPLASPITTNIGVATMIDGSLAAAVGTSDNSFTILQKHEIPLSPYLQATAPNQLEIYGSPDTTHQLESSPNTSDWFPVTTLTIPESGSATIPLSNTDSPIFYRTRSQ